MTDADLKELDGLPWHPLLSFSWGAVRVAGDHLLGIPDLRLPVPPPEDEE